MKTIIILALTMVCLTANAQQQMTDDNQMNDTIINKMEIQSIVVRRQNTPQTINPNALRITKPVTTCSQQSVFCKRDDVMWAKDYTIGTFLSDVLIGQ